MAKTLRSESLAGLQKRKAGLLKDLPVPSSAIRASYVKQRLTCGKPNCRCRHGHKHGPFHYLVQCLAPGKIEKFLLKTESQKRNARAGIDAYSHLQKWLEELSRINTEILRRGHAD